MTILPDPTHSLLAVTTASFQPGYMAVDKECRPKSVQTALQMNCCWEKTAEASLITSQWTETHQQNNKILKTVSRKCCIPTCNLNSSFLATKSREGEEKAGALQPITRIPSQV
ncbi:hypothetical protein RRG08_031655 [Elysia crispata]|uniref:Uncharacterized protein n=1 Tax=Elysia crispata TaxID=231223 RepID=A0AAE0YYY9_9GAST|nr:hypothetical protein RRG08_031655 [Elysia crispata]